MQRALFWNVWPFTVATIVVSLGACSDVSSSGTGGAPGGAGGGGGSGGGPDATAADVDATPPADIGDEALTDARGEVGGDAADAAETTLLDAGDTSETPVTVPGGTLWAQRFGDKENDIARAVAVDGAGNVYLTGSFWGTVSFGDDPISSSGEHVAFVAKYDRGGRLQWAKPFGAVGEGMALAVDGTSVVVAGWFARTIDLGGGALTSAGEDDIFVAKLDASGAHVWSKRFGGVLTDHARGVATDGDGNVYATGYVEGSADFGGGAIEAKTRAGFVVKLTKAGAFAWSRGFGDEDASGVNVAADATGATVVTGTFSGKVDLAGTSTPSAGTFDGLVMKLDASGKPLWGKTFGDPAGASAANGILVDATGGVTFVGTFSGRADLGGGARVSAGGFDIVVASLDSAGKHVWSKAYGGAGDDFGIGIASVGTGLAITGSIGVGVDFGGGPLGAAAGDQLFVARLDGTAKHLWSRAYGNGAVGRAIGADRDGDVYVGGTFPDTINLGLGPLASAGGNDIVFGKLAR